MSFKSKLKKGAGFAKEELGEKLGNEKMARKGRQLRNEGRIAEGQAPKTKKPGTGNK